MAGFGPVGPDAGRSGRGPGSGETERTYLFGDVGSEAEPTSPASEQPYSVSWEGPDGQRQPELEEPKGRSKKALIGVGTALAGTAAVRAALFGLKAGSQQTAKGPANGLTACDRAALPLPPECVTASPNASRVETSPSAIPTSPERLLMPAVIQTEQGPLEFTTPAMEGLITYGEPGQP